MLYYTNKARKTAIENITSLIVKLANTKPTEQFTLQDIESAINYLSNMNTELHREIKINPGC